MVVGIDGRTDYYGADYIRHYIDMVKARPGWQDTFDALDADVVVLERTDALVGALETEGWTRVLSGQGLRHARKGAFGMNVRLRLVLASALMLFLELALIRWLTGNVVHLGYFSNFVLLGSFLGVGLGFLRWNPHRGRPYYFPVALAGLVLLVLAFPVSVNRGTQSAE